MKQNIVPIILAGGRGTRMRTEYPKPLHEILGKPMIGYILDSIKEAGLSDPVVVVGYKSDVVRKALPGVKVVTQTKALGSADAVKIALASFRKDPKDVLILCGDAPFVRAATIKKTVAEHRRSASSATVMTAQVDNPYGYGRIVRNSDDSVERIVEELDATDDERSITEVNSGSYCFHTKDLRAALKKVRPNNRKKEYYLTDAIEALNESGKRVGAVLAASYDEIIGINTRSELAEAIRIKRTEVLETLMANGVTIVDPPTTWISPDAKIGSDTVVFAHTIIEGSVVIGKHCKIGPFSKIRKGVILDNHVAVGNLAELVRTKVGAHTKIKHMSYLGDVTVGKHVNIGAGFIVANYDGKNKSKSVIGDGAFIGVGSILVAPAKVGKRALVGAGCVVTSNFPVPDGATVVGVPARILKRKKR